MCVFVYDHDCACRAMASNYADTGQAIASADRPMWVYSDLLADNPVAGQANVVFEHAYVHVQLLAGRGGYLRHNYMCMALQQ